jgi:transcriptional regulator with XRE-family HTH domain
MSTPALQPDPRIERRQPSPQSRRDQSWRRQPEHRPAVNAYERDRYRQQQAGTWAPFTPTGPVRDHIDQLREAGMTSERIAHASGVSVSTLTRLFKVTRLSATAAEAILAVHPPEQPAAATDPAQQLQALVADGWTKEQLAAAAGLNDRTIWQAVHGNTTPSPRTAAAVRQLYEALRLEDPGDDTAAVRARLRAERNGWVPTTSPASLTPQQLVDPVAIDRAVQGDHVPLQPAEQQAALRRLAGHHSDGEIGRRLGVTTRTVVRHRTSQGLPAYTPVPPIDGPSR